MTAPDPPSAVGAPGLTRLVHGKVSLALHHLSDGRTSGGGAGTPPGSRGGSPPPPLLVLHGLGEQAPGQIPAWAEGWPGPVHALDFTGHGGSTVPTGGGYTAEALMGDADAALAHLGPCTVVGRGLGAYVALLIAGARPHLVRGAVLGDGPGLAGGGPAPGSPHIVQLPAHLVGPPDPWALVELSRDLRPPDYAASFAWQAANLSELAVPITISVAALIRPEWLAAVAATSAVQELPLVEALSYYASS